MKRKIFTTISLIFLVSVLYAQDDIQKVQEALGKDKKELVHYGMMLSPADSVKFWPLYTQYEAQRQKIGRERILILDDYAKSYYSMTNAKADEVVSKILKNEAALNQLQQQYYTKVKTALNAMQAAKFLHIESYINSSVKSMLLGALPVIEQMDVPKKSL
jgi:hypothetical protein